jgi:hypothetical protein
VEGITAAGRCVCRAVRRSHGLELINHRYQPTWDHSEHSATTIAPRGAETGERSVAAGHHWGVELADKITPSVGFLVPLTRFSGFVWLIVAGFKLPELKDATPSPDGVNR